MANQNKRSDLTAYDDNQGGTDIASKTLKFNIPDGVMSQSCPQNLLSSSLCLIILTKVLNICNHCVIKSIQLMVIVLECAGVVQSVQL